jgi:hypothetical protein
MKMEMKGKYKRKMFNNTQKTKKEEKKTFFTTLHLHVIVWK